MKVAHLVSGDLWAGAEVATHQLLVALAAAGIEPSAVVLNPGRLAEQLAADGIPTAIVPEAGRRFPALARDVRAQLAHADLVHAHGYKQDVLAALSGRPWLCTLHGRPEPQRGAARLRMASYTLADRLCQRFAARRVVAVSREIEEWLAPRVGAGRVVRAWNGIADPDPRREAPRFAVRPLRVGVLARLFPVKNVALAVEAVARARRDVELEVVGDGPEAPRLRALARSLGAEQRIRFAGFDPEPCRRLARWRLLLVPSLHEGNPINVLEALACGTPVLSAPLAGVDEILDGRGGWLIADRDPSRWAAAIDERIADEAGGDAASRSGRARFAEAFTAETGARRMLGLYRELLAPTRARMAPEDRGCLPS